MATAKFGVLVIRAGAQAEEVQGGVRISVAYGDRPMRFLQVVALVAGVTLDEVRSAWIGLSATSEPVQLGAGWLVWDGITDRYCYEESGRFAG